MTGGYARRHPPRGRGETADLRCHARFKPVAAFGRGGACGKHAFECERVRGRVSCPPSRCQPARGRVYSRRRRGCFAAGEAHQEGRDRRQVRCVSHETGGCIYRSPGLSNASQLPQAKWGRSHPREPGRRSLYKRGWVTSVVRFAVRAAAERAERPPWAIHGWKSAQLHSVRASGQAANRRLCGDLVYHRPAAPYASAHALQAAANTARDLPLMRRGGCGAQARATARRCVRSPRRWRPASTRATFASSAVSSPSSAWRRASGTALPARGPRLAAPTC